MSWIRWFCLFLLLASMPVVADEQPTVVVFSRHTFRGVGYNVAPQYISVGSLQLDLPMLSYGMDATAHGQELAQRYGAPAINEVTRLAVGELGGKFNGHWDEIRAELGSGRDFFTGLYFRFGLQPLQDSPILLTGCPTRAGQHVDLVTVGGPIRSCIPVADLRSLQVGTANEKRTQKTGQDLLNLVSEGLGLPQAELPPYFDSQGKPRAQYSDLITLASTIEMASEEGPPLATLFPDADPKRLSQLDPQAVALASGFLGTEFTLRQPLKLACATSVIPLEYVQSCVGRHVILATHDDDISSLLRALQILREDGPLDSLTMLPMESIVIAFDSQRASVARTSMQIAPDGSLPGPFASTVLWSGTRAQWDARVQKVKDVAAGWPAGAAQRAQFKILPASTLNVLYRPCKN